MVIGLNAKGRTIKLLEEREDLWNLGLAKKFLELTAKAKLINTIKIKTFCSSGDPV